jgi:predicted transcriptional regulator
VYRPAGVSFQYMSAAKHKRRAKHLSPGAKLSGMELHLTPETQLKLNALAQRTHRGTDELLEEAVDHLVLWNEWLEKKVSSSIAAAQHGAITSNEDVGAWLESIRYPRTV